MKIKTRVFELVDGKYASLSDLAHKMGISVSQVYRVKTGKRNINEKFIAGAVKAFPQHSLDQLFYLALESPPDNNEKQGATIRHRYMVNQYMVNQYSNSPSPTRASW